MKEFELRPVDPGFTAQVEAAQDAAQELAANVMGAMHQLMEKAIQKAIEHGATPEEMTVSSVDGDLQLVVRGRAVFEVTSKLLDVEPTVTGEWLVWPLPDPEPDDN